MHSGLDRTYRAAALRALSDAELDVLVVGGGIVGAGAALDAASRGLSVALVEAHDWAFGTSSRSSKLIHGGLRYLEQRDFGLVREALRERSLLLHRLAPHLVRPVPFLYPLRHRGWERAYVGAGVALYDSIGGARALPRHRHLSRRRVQQLAPSLRDDALTGAVGYFDAQVDDARYTMMVARTAARHGATVVTRARVTGLVRENAADPHSRVVGAHIRDLESGTQLAVRARRVISAAGVWTDDVHEFARAEAPFSVRMSKGVHVLVPRQRIQLSTGLITRTEKSVLFVIPWGGYWIVGTTDTPWDQDPSSPVATRADVEYVLEHVNDWLREPLGVHDVVGVYAGLRPLLAGESDETAQLSREHAVAEPAPGLFVVAGGKYTTYRVMAADVVDVAVRGLGRVVPPSLTERLPILGAVGFHEMQEERQDLARRLGVAVGRVDRLLGRYGSMLADLSAMIDDDPRLAEPVSGAPAYLKAEVVYAATHEGALHLDDVLARRTRIAIETARGGAACAREVAELIGSHLDWAGPDIAAEVDRYVDEALAEHRGWAATATAEPEFDSMEEVGARSTS
ncbi:glycerol-3-phosphate dehydrogenase/oxidase [Phytoactinopolyspora limicola]|uniref:glycerol-3-phosphate dehydrogenase/oxidase n=1 Tax=Phytoactinopolyspora limicola TaxID=2715536 RepID=UPI0014084073|nr:glycerol-3-phosphate dehydrogenase/oxidase [Phytoactinopolyspora limicola]